jgi:hypothetical protein
VALFRGASIPRGRQQSQARMISWYATMTPHESSYSPSSFGWMGGPTPLALVISEVYPPSERRMESAYSLGELAGTQRLCYSNGYKTSTRLKAAMVISEVAHWESLGEHHWASSSRGVRTGATHDPQFPISAGRSNGSFKGMWRLLPHCRSCGLSNPFRIRGTIAGGNSPEE